MNLEEKQENKQMKFDHLFLHLIRVIQLYITQLRISLRKRNNVLGLENIKVINTQ